MACSLPTDWYRADEKENNEPGYNREQAFRAGTRKAPFSISTTLYHLDLCLVDPFLHVAGGIAINRESNDGNSVKTEYEELPLLLLFNEKRTSIEKAESRWELPESAAAKSEDI